MEDESCLCGYAILGLISFIIGMVANWCWCDEPKDLKPKWKQVIFINCIGFVGFVVFNVVYCIILFCKWFWDFLGKEWFPEEENDDKNFKK